MRAIAIPRVRTVLELLVAAGGLRLLTEGGKRLRQEPRPSPAGPAAAAARQPLSPLLEEAVFDYWRSALDSPTNSATVLDWQLFHLERFVIPPLGHLRVTELEPRLLEAYAVLIKSELPGAAVFWICEASIAVIAHAQPSAEEAARFALRAGLA